MHHVSHPHHPTSNNALRLKRTCRSTIEPTILVLEDTNQKITKDKRINRRLFELLKLRELSLMPDGNKAPSCAAIRRKSAFFSYGDSKRTRGRLVIVSTHMMVTRTFPPCYHTDPSQGIGGVRVNPIFGRRSVQKLGSRFLFRCTPFPLLSQRHVL